MPHDTTPLVIFDPNGEGTATVPAHQYETVWRKRGWTLTDPQVDRPAANDLKAVWEVYAATKGVDTTGMTKTQIIAATAAPQTPDGQTVAGDNNEDAREGVEEDS